MFARRKKICDETWINKQGNFLNITRFKGRAIINFKIKGIKLIVIRRSIKHRGYIFKFFRFQFRNETLNFSKELMEII